MKLITQRNLIKNIAKMWKQAYCNKKNGWQTLLIRDNTKDIYDSLLKLDLNTCSNEDVSNIIGNCSFTLIVCDECRRGVKEVVQIGEKEDFGSRTCDLCLSCLHKAMKKMGVKK